MEESRYLQTRKVTLVGAVLDFVLGVGKIISGIVGHSQGLIADGVHSLSDLVTDGLVIWAAKYGTQEADDDHPYGHERIQTVTTVLLGAGLIAVSLGIGKDAVDRLITPGQLETPLGFTLVIAFVSIVSKEWIYHYTMRVARRIKSKLLEANAWHSRSDALSSIIVLIGILGAQAGFTYLDSLAALVVAIMIIRVGGKMILDGLRELVDTGVDKSEIESMKTTMRGVEGVLGVHQLRTRKMGATILADVHVHVNPDISVSEGHRIADEVEQVIHQLTNDPMDITVHIDPEDDSEDQVTLLPMREELEQLLSENWKLVSDLPVQSVGIHYLAQKVDIELVVADKHINTMAELSSQANALKEKLGDIDYLGDVKVLVEVETN